jgi:sulfur relay protein TusB/DsrH
LRLGVFISDFKYNQDILERLKAEKLGVFLVSNGVYNATIKEDGKASPLLEKDGAKFYVLLEDLQTRGFGEDEVDKNVSVVTYGDIVDLIMGEYEKLAWL